MYNAFAYALMTPFSRESSHEKIVNRYKVYLFTNFSANRVSLILHIPIRKVLVLVANTYVPVTKINITFI